MIELTDPSNKLIYEMHQYLDSDGSGTSDVCVNSTIGQSRVESVTQWLISNQKVAFLGEFAAGANSLCEEAVTGMLSYMEQNSDVWLGAEWWSAGSWWGDYLQYGASIRHWIRILRIRLGALFPRRLWPHDHDHDHDHDHGYDLYCGPYLYN
jgi:aryl-phospho-beta-D-glucosidase BglC (GH1 family)